MKHKKTTTENRSARETSNAFSSLMRRQAVHCLCIIVIGLLVYSNTLSSEFVFDDIPSITENPAVRSFRALMDYKNTVADTVLQQHIGSRFIGYASFVLNYQVHGTHVAGYHLVNICTHLMNAILVYLIVLMTFRLRLPGSEANNNRLCCDQGYALLVALLFVVHPVQIQAVTYIVQRLASLAAFFYLGALYAYIRFRIAGPTEKRYVWYGVALMAAVLAMKTKETAFTLPLVIGLYEAIFLDGTMKARIGYLAPMVLTMVIIPVSLLEVSQHPLEALISNLSEKTRDASAPLSRSDYLMTQFSVICTYLRLLVFPANQNLYYDYPVNTSLFDVRTLSSLVLLLSIVVAGVMMLVSARTHSRQESREMYCAAFGIFFFFITLSVESSIVPLAGVIYEYRLYLPSIGYFLSIVSLGSMIRNRFSHAAVRKAMAVFSIMLVGGYAWTAFAYNGVWKTEISLWEDVVAKSPAKPLPHNNLGLAYERSGRIADAFREYGNALKADHNYVEAYNNLGSLYERSGYTDAALRTYVAGIAKHPDNATLYYNLGVLHERLGNLDEAARTYQHAIKLNAKFAEAHNNLGVIYLRKGMFDKAVSHFNQALEVRPDFERARLNLENTSKLHL